MSNTSLSIWVVLFAVAYCLLFFSHSTTGLQGTVVKRDEQRTLVSTEFGEISGVKVSDGRNGFYQLQFITMDPNSLFIPVQLHSDMVFYVISGSGTLSWVDVEKDGDKIQQVGLRMGDVYRLRSGSYFYIQTNLESDRRKFRISAIFSDSKEEIPEGSSFGAYSTLADLLLGFDDRVLQAALNVNQEVIQELRSGRQQSLIVHGVSPKESVVHDRSMRAFRAFVGFLDQNGGIIEANGNKKSKAYNILEAKHDFENCNGWSLVVTSKQMKTLRDSDFGIFMVNLTKGAMMAPHWNPVTPEIAVVLSGRGMVHVVCPSSIDESECKSSRFRVEEGDVFVVPRYHPMAQISFNNGSFVFMGFTTTQRNNHPQYLVGSASVFQVLDKRVLAASLGVSNTTMDKVTSAQQESIILECISCAEEEERLMEEEARKEEEERRKEEEARKREEEEEARREEEEARKREEEEEARREEEEARKREEEEARKREEEEAERREEEEARKREEEEAARREEEEARKREEEEARRREEEEAARREEEEAARREEEEARRREEEEARRREEEAAAREEEEARKWQEEQEAKRREEARQREEEAAREEEEEATRREAARKQGEAMRRRQEEEAARRQQEEDAARRHQQEEEAARQQEEEVARRQQEEEAGRQEEEDMSRRQQEQEEEARRGEEPWGSADGSGTEGGGQRAQEEGDAAVKQEEEMAKRMTEEEAGDQSIKAPQTM